MTGADLVFTPETHTYALPDGRTVPSVTQVIAAVGVSTDFESLATISAPIREAIELRRDLGSAVHSAAHYFDDQDLHYETLDSRVLPYLEAWGNFRATVPLAPITRERRVFHPTLQYAGTLDGVFRQPDGTLVVIDLKIGDPGDAACDLQTSAYAAAFEAEHPDQRIAARWGVRLMPDRRVPYRIHRYTAWDDFAKFQACLCVYWLQAERRRTR